MKTLSMIILFISIFQAHANAGMLECQAEDSNYSISFVFKTKMTILDQPIIQGNLFAQVNDNPSEFKKNYVSFYNNTKQLFTITRKQDHRLGRELLFGAMIDLSQNVDGVYYGAAILKSNEELELPTNDQVLSSLVKNLNDPNGSGTISCEIKDL